MDIKKKKKVSSKKAVAKKKASKAKIKIKPTSGPSKKVVEAIKLLVRKNKEETPPVVAKPDNDSAMTLEIEKTVLQCADLRNTIIEVEKTKIDSFYDGWQQVPEFNLPNKNVMALRFQRKDAKSYYMFYFNEVLLIENWVALENDFKIKIKKPSEELKPIIDKYNKFILQNLPMQLNLGMSSGSDPEVFVEKGNGELFPAFQFLGSKDKPNRSTTYTNGYTNNIYWDGFQAEFDVGANTCVAYMLDSVQNGLRNLLQAARAKDPQAKLSAKTVYDIPVNLLQESAPEHVAFGCLKSLNAYGMKGLEAPGQEVLYRTAGGHIHFGINNLADDKALNMVKALDAILGVACVSMFAKFDDPRRRQMYGLAGEYRRPAHGLEYRVLSNAWLFHPLIANIVYDLARPAALMGYKGFLHYWKASEADTIKCINECNVELARKILTENKEVLIKILFVKMGRFAEFIYDVIMNGMESILFNPTDIEGNWLLSGNWVQHCSAEGKNIASVYEIVVKNKKKILV